MAEEGGGGVRHSGTVLHAALAASSGGEETVKVQDVLCPVNDISDVVGGVCMYGHHI